MNTQNKEKPLLWIMIATVLVVGVSILKYPENIVNYYNSDATWHTLLTIEAYSETPISDHLFLPIVTLGNNDDKGISWGSTVPDTKGNYYYTSFSPAGYFLPWTFMKIFRLPVVERSLYIFNTVLFVLSAVLWIWLLSLIYKENKNVNIIMLIGLLTYVLSPELLHGMGIVYWHQSIMQVTLLIQVIAYYKIHESNTKISRMVFYMMSLINPYIEWTGYVANVGFALTELILSWKKDRKLALKRVLILGILSMTSFALFVIHYLLRVDAYGFLVTLKSRFMARNVTASIPITDVFRGYIKSFAFFWVVLLVLIVWNFIRNRKVELKHGIWLLVLTFPLIENVVMKEHAVAYTYDRMKGIFCLSFLICELSSNLMESLNRRIITKISLISLSAVVGIMNLTAYVKNDTYIWEANWREENEILADYLNKEYPNSVLGMEHAVRGYMNLLFGRGIFEHVNEDNIQRIASAKGETYAVLLDVGNNGAWNMYDLVGATIYNVSDGSAESVVVKNGNVCKTEYPDQEYQLANWTDENWTNGYSNTGSVLLFYRHERLLNELLSKENLIADENIYHIENVDYDDTWIRVLVDKDASDCMYPTEIRIE